MFVLLLSINAAASAQVPVTTQEPTEPKPAMIRSSLDPDTGVYVGQKVRLYIDVMTNAWFAKAPQYPELRIPHAICLELSQFGTNYSERIQGETYAIQRKEYVIYPQRAERYTIPSLTVNIVYARPGESSVEVTLTTPSLEFEARIPEQAQGVDYFVSTPRLEVREQYDRAFEDMKVGDAVTRSITMTADDSVGMMLPPIEFGKIESMAVYPKAPKTENTSNRGQYTGTRIESATYVMEAEGEYVLPEIKIFWFDLSSQELRVETLERVEFTVAENPDLEAEMLAFLEEEEIEVEEEAPSIQKNQIDVKALLYLALAIFIVAAALWIFLFPRIKKFRAWWKQKKLLKAESEETYFRYFRSACRSSDSHQVMQSLLNWLDKIHPGPGAATVEEFVQLADDLELQALAAGLKEELYGSLQGDESHPTWQGADFYNSVANARKRLLKEEKVQAKPTGLMPLNP
ncbi:MAG: hypothetical protein ACERKR_11815 [Deltaproteobacteria bacterium]